MRRSIASSSGGPSSLANEKFSIKRVPAAFASLPRVLRLVWSTSSVLTVMLGLLSLAQGFMPAVTVTISGLVIDSVVRAIRIQSIAPIWLPVVLQLGAALASSLLSTFSNTVQQLLQEQVANRVQLDIL
jgi:ATP-binding cassette, subfamily B, bacterial